MKFKYNTDIVMGVNAYSLVNKPPYTEIYLVEPFTVAGRMTKFNLIATDMWEQDTGNIFIAQVEKWPGPANMNWYTLTFIDDAHVDEYDVPSVVPIRKISFNFD